MKATYSFLEPIVVGKKTFKNRIVLAAMAKYFSNPDGFISDRFLDYYGNMAAGGPALITPGIMVIDPDWPYISTNQPRLSDDKFIPGLRKFAQRIHAHDALACCQLWHPGLAGAPKEYSINSFSIDQIHSIQEMYISAARRVKEAGVDAVDFHLAHTYLPSQFLSPYFNKRTDQYGADTIENATRFSVEVIERIKKELCDDDFFITSKINGDDFVEGGTTPEWAAEAAVLIEKAGVSMITMNGGGALTKTIGMSDDGRQPEGWKVPFAELVKQKVKIPVAACGSIRHPEYADQIIREGKCDIVSIGRGLLAEPRWVIKAAESREDEMRVCISCMYCFAVTAPGVSGCSVNPFAKRESELRPLDKNGKGRVVAVIGAGPSGLEATITLAERGFKPVLFEKDTNLGGQVQLAAIPPGKTKLGWFVHYYQKQIDRLGIEVRLGTEATVEAIKALAPYAVVMATGSNEFIPQIPGINNENVLHVRDVLKNHAHLRNKNIVILGGGLTGLETARLLKAQGNDVTVLEMADLHPPANMEAKIALEDLKEEGIALKEKHKVLRIENSHVVVCDLVADKEVSFNADYLILSLGIRPNNAFADLLEKNQKNVIRVGDCASLGKIYSAVQSGSTAGFALQ